MRANSMARKLQTNNVYGFWKEVKVVNNSKMTLPSSMMALLNLKILQSYGGDTMRTFLTVWRVDVFNMGEITHSDGVVIGPEEVCYAIDKLKMNKSLWAD